MGRWIQLWKYYELPVGLLCHLFKIQFLWMECAPIILFSLCQTFMASIRNGVNPVEQWFYLNEQWFYLKWFPLSWSDWAHDSFRTSGQPRSLQSMMGSVRLEKYIFMTTVSNIILIIHLYFLCKHLFKFSMYLLLRIY